MISNLLAYFSRSKKRCCRFCLEEDSQKNLISPCNCRGSIEFVHLKCLFNWIVHSQNVRCRICKSRYAIGIAYKPLSECWSTISQLDFPSRAPIYFYSITFVLCLFGLSLVVLDGFPLLHLAGHSIGLYISWSALKRILLPQFRYITWVNKWNKSDPIQDWIDENELLIHVIRERTQELRQERLARIEQESSFLRARLEFMWGQLQE